MGAAEKKHGFAALTPERHKEIAARGGRAAHAGGNAHTFSYEEASLAGEKGGLKVSQDVEHMKRIGRKGGLANKGKVRS